jgi:hypothetical protein
MSITTEEAERRAAHLHKFWGLDGVAEMIRSLAAERDALRAERNAERNARFEAKAEFSHMQRRIARQRRALAKLYAKRHDKNGRLASFLTGLAAENARMKEVLERLARLGNEPHYGNSDGNTIARAELERISRAGETQ